MRFSSSSGTTCLRIRLAGVTELRGLPLSPFTRSVPSLRDIAPTLLWRETFTGTLIRGL